MDLVVQPNFVERTVFEAARQNAALRPHYERQFAECYDYREGHRRDQAFAKLHERWFDELGLRDLIAGLVNEFPHFRDQVSRLMVTQAPGPKTQTAELFGKPGQYTVVVAVAPAVLLNRPGFEYWARHEFQHVDDMLNPAFGYEATARPSGETAAAKSLAQDRYAVLWALSVDARLMKRGLAPADVRERRRAEVMQAFALSETELSSELFEKLWEPGNGFTPSHLKFLEWAQDGLPDPGLGGIHRHKAGEQQQAGAPCPLCGFPTFDWAMPDCNHAELADVILADFPKWKPDQAICERCAEIYRSIAGARPVSL